MPTFSSTEFNQQVSKAQRAAFKAPVFVTSRGKLSHVLLSYAEYQRLTGGRAQSGLDALTPPPELAEKLAGIELDLPPRNKAHRRAVDFEGV